jgi:hypothetical protein
LQFVKVNTVRGVVVLASDVTHLYENVEAYRPFTTALHIGETLDTLRTHSVAKSDRSCHDPEVMRRYPAPTDALRGIAVRLDVEPII